MSIKQVQIRVQDLTLGMYVSGLDRPWSQTPFPLQGFHVRSPKDIETVKSYCTHVFIDVTKGRGPVKPADIVSTVTDASDQGQSAHGQPIRPFSLQGEKFGGPSSFAPPKPSPIQIRKGVYETTTPMRIEAGKAQQIVRELKGHLTVATKLIAKGKPVDYKALKGAAENMVDSVLRCPDAFTWLLRLRQKDQHVHDHTLRSALWAVQFARYAGMDKDQIAVLCLGTLLKDVGKIKIPGTILRKQIRTPEEEAQYRKFVDFGVDALRSTGTIEPKVISVVRYHCERMDGSGFPQGIAGNKIPLLARITGIATVYDAISNPRESAEPVAPSRAVSMLYNMRGTGFQEDLVVNFIQSIGLYPTGTVVELTTGDLGVVLEQHPKSRLTPTVAVLDRVKADLNSDCIIIDLKDEQQSRRRLIQSGRDNIMNVGKLAIARDLEPGGYDIDFNRISTSFMESVKLAVLQQAEGEETAKRGFFASLREKLLH